MFGPTPFGPTPFGSAHCAPPRCGPRFRFEGGGRVYYSTNYARIVNDDAVDLDFIEDLNFPRNTLHGEVYGAFRIPPRLALTYTFTIPRVDRGFGALPIDMIVGETLFAAGTQVEALSTVSLHRWEAEYFFKVGCKFRAGPLLLGELFVTTLKLEAGAVDDQEAYTEFIMGAGVTSEFAPAHNLFFKCKAAYTFLQNQGGVDVDGEAKFFPEFGRSGCNPYGSRKRMRPYVGMGYRYKAMTYHGQREGNQRTRISSHGPFASLGVIF